MYISLRAPAHSRSENAATKDIVNGPFPRVPSVAASPGKSPGNAWHRRDAHISRRSRNPPSTRESVTNNVRRLLRYITPEHTYLLLLLRKHSPSSNVYPRRTYRTGRCECDKDRIVWRRGRCSICLRVLCKHYLFKKIFLITKKKTNNKKPRGPRFR